MKHSIFAIEVCARIDPSSPLRESLHRLISTHPERATHREKWELYHIASELLLADLNLLERGCWDYFNDDSRAKSDYDMWLKGMTTEEGARTEPSGSADPYRSSGPRYMTFTVAFLLLQGTASDQTMLRLCDIHESGLWQRATFTRILQGMGQISFASVLSDVVYLIPRDDGWGLTLEDLAHPKFQYLRPIVD